MIVRERARIEPVEWGNGLSHRLLVQADRMGFTVCHTLVRAGTKSALQYRSHLEACYCLSGTGWVEPADGGAGFDLYPGVLYALDQHDAHYLIAGSECDLELVSIFNPPLLGDERHDLSSGEFSQY